jgi:hypothetical protein
MAAYRKAVMSIWLDSAKGCSVGSISRWVSTKDSRWMSTLPFRRVW